MALTTPGSSDVKSFRKWVNKVRKLWCSCQGHLNVLMNFFCCKILLISFSRYIKTLIMSALNALETRLTVPILVKFWRFVAFIKLFVSAQTFNIGQWLFYEKLVNSINFSCSTRFFHDNQFSYSNLYSAH